MFPAWRLKLREVQVAVDSGRYEEAIALLDEKSLREFRPAKELAQQVAGKMVERASDRFARGDSAAGWQDLQVAERLGGQSDAVSKLREQIVTATLDEVRRYLAAGQLSAAVARLAKLGARACWENRAGCSNRSPTRCSMPRKRRDMADSPKRLPRSSGLEASPPARLPERVQWISPGNLKLGAASVRLSRRKASGSRPSCMPGWASKIGRRCSRRRRPCWRSRRSTKPPARPAAGRGRQWGWTLRTPCIVVGRRARCRSLGIERRERRRQTLDAGRRSFW